MLIEERSILTAKTSIESINSFLKIIIKPSCIICDLSKCSDCIFKNGTFNGKFKYSKQKYIILYFFYNKHLNYIYPAHETEKSYMWKSQLIIHHKNCNHYDDSKENLVMWTMTKHAKFHNNKRELQKILPENLAIAFAYRNLLLT